MNKDLIDDRFGRFREIPLALALMGQKVTGLCLSYAQRKEGWVDDGPVMWKSINATPFKFPGLLRFIFEARRQVKNSDIIWACSDSFYGVIGCVLGKLYNVPVVFDIYDNFGKFLIAQLPLAKQLYHWAIRNSNALTCLSKPFVEYIRNNFDGRTNVFPIEFAVRHDLFKPMDKLQCRKNLSLPLHAQLVGTAGAINKKREVNLLFDAFNQLKLKYSDLHLVVAGQRDRSIQIPRDPKVFDFGTLPFERVPELINTLDVAVVCYADDDYGKYCFPQKTREFMACNVPVIAAGVGGLRDIFRGNPHWLYEPGSAGSLARTLEKRLSDQTTNYAPGPGWRDLAQKLERIMVKISADFVKTNTAPPA
jgi:glycosyltransferase involved in cell wall biosynthesis